jgi:hypothetical protein
MLLGRLAARGQAFDRTGWREYPGSAVFRARRVIVVLAALVAASWIPACAKDVGVDGSSAGGSSGDASVEGGSGSGAGGSGADGGWPIGGFGSPCAQDEHCTTKQCTDIGQNKQNLVCTQVCGTSGSCPSNGYCAYHPEKGYICIPDTDNQCAKCVIDDDCPNIGDKCALSPKVDRFCARDCSNDGVCAAGYTCVDVADYPPGLNPDGGVPDAGGGDAGGGKPPRICVPENNDSCPCNAKRDGVKRLCSQQSGSLTCEGTEKCNGTTGKWEGCTAGSPQPEVCDGADNDCNGAPDDADVNQLCTGTLPHATWSCHLGACLIGACDPGWSHYPPALPQTAGCPCATDAGEPNETCATATAAGSVTDANTTALTIKGRLSSDVDEDWWSFDAIDFDETTTNSYHVRIVFSAPATNDEFVFSVVRGDACSVPDAKHSNLTEYDWCVDGQATVGGQTIGEQTCSATGPIHCGPHTKKYFLKVSRKTGAAGTCAEYTLTVTAKGSFNCDFSKACDTQVSEI